MSAAAAAEARYRARSLWLDGVPGSLAPRPALEGDRDADVAVVGAGYTGLWTAYSLARLDPRLRIVVLEAETAGYGASGRNGGFVSAGIAGEARVYARRGGPEAVVRAERAFIDGIAAIGAVVDEEGIECGWVQGGSLRVATSRTQLERVRAGVAARRARGYGKDDVRLVSAAEIEERVRFRSALGGSYTPHCARVDPARLARGLAEACERRGVVVHEATPALAVEPGRVRCATGTVRAPFVVRATESYTTRLPGERRRYLPVYSHMLATEPLPPDVWAEIGWDGCETIADQRHLFLYCQRTTDGRIAAGGRGASYRFGSVIVEGDEVAPAIHARVEEALRAHFPEAAGARVTHRWGGPFGAPRDWTMGVTLDRATGLVVAGGLSGHGVVGSHLAGRTAADLVLGRETELTAMPWTGHAGRRWEPEPLRFAAQRLVTRILGGADAAEERTGRPARRLALVRRFTPGR